MTRNKKFQLALIVEIILIAVFNFLPLDIVFYQNPFYFAGMALGVYVMLTGLVYYCPKCQRHQILTGNGLSVPKEHCWNCGTNINEHTT